MQSNLHPELATRRSEVVGRPLAALLANDGARVFSVDIDSVQVSGRFAVQFRINSHSIRCSLASQPPKTSDTSLRRLIYFALRPISTTLPRIILDASTNLPN